MNEEKGHVEIKDVSKTFARSDLGTTLTALEGVNIDVKPGEFVSIVGASGCGKSTLLRIIAGLETATTGQALCDGKPIKGTDSSRGLAFQDHSLFPWLSVWENVAFGLRACGKYKGNEETVKRLIQMAGLEEFQKSYPHQLSGGMQQRVSLARALAVAPDVLLLDEPLGALDAFTRMNMQDEIISTWQRQKNTMILITHDVDEAIYLSQRIFVMTSRPGRISREIKLDMSYPRNRSASDFVEVRSSILQELNFATEVQEDYYL